MQGGAGNIFSIYFPVPRLSGLVDKARFDKNGALAGAYVELLCTDSRLGNQLFGSQPSVVEQVVTVVNNELAKASIRIASSTKGVITGIGFAWQFQRVAAGKTQEPSPTWRTQIILACAKKLAEYGYEFSGEAKENGSAMFYFVEKRPVLNELLGS